MDDHFTKADPKLTGFLTCLTFLKNGYRWAALPVLPEEKERESLTFPDNINLPLDKVSTVAIKAQPKKNHYFIGIFFNYCCQLSTLMEEGHQKK